MVKFHKLSTFSRTMKKSFLVSSVRRSSYNPFVDVPILIIFVYLWYKGYASLGPEIQLEPIELPIESSEVEKQNSSFGFNCILLAIGVVYVCLRFLR